MDITEMEPKEYVKQMTAIVGRNIRRYREQKGWAQQDLAAALDVSVKMISKYENGESVCNIGYLKILADFLNVSLMDMLGENDEKAKTQEFITKWQKLPMPVREFIKKGTEAFLGSC